MTDTKPGGRLKPKNEIFVLRLTAGPNCPDAIRALLKIALRRSSIERVQP